MSASNLQLAITAQGALRNAVIELGQAAQLRLAEATSTLAELIEHLEDDLVAQSQIISHVSTAVQSISNNDALLAFQQAHLADMKDQLQRKEEALERIQASHTTTLQTIIQSHEDTIRHMVREREETIRCRSSRATS